MNIAEKLAQTDNESRQRVNAVGHISAKCSKRTPGYDQNNSTPNSSLSQLYQQGSARIRIPNTESAALHAVLLNTAGGLTGNDHIHWKADAEKLSHLCVSTAACEKIYRTHGPAAIQQNTLHVAHQARLEWLPQESILFNGSHLSRCMDVHLAEQAEALIVESLVLGRQAMNEQVDSICVRDRWRIYRDKHLLHAEDFHLDMRSNKLAQTQCMMHQYGAITTLVLVTNQSDDWFDAQLSRVRALLPSNSLDIRMGASVLPSRLVVRALAQDSFQLRKFLIPCIELLNDGRPVPTVWNV
ncbi:MAG: urease accessory protein UreD [Granulosicoccus sp.]